MPAANGEPEDVARPELRQGDIVEYEGGRFAVISRSCDLVRAHPARAVIAPVVETADPHALRGWDLRLLRVPGLDDLVIDMSEATSVPKEGLPQEAMHSLETAGQARAFATDAARALGEASHPDGLNKTVEPLWDELRRTRYRAEGEYSNLADAIVDVRVRLAPPDLSPRDEESPRSLELQMIVSEEYSLRDEEELAALEQAEELGHDGDALKQTRDAWSAATSVGQQAFQLAVFCHQLAARCDAVPPVDHVTTTVVSMNQYSYADLMQSDAVRVDRLSAGAGSVA